MLHLRAICPPELTARVLDQLEANLAVTHLCVSPGAARKPAGDVVVGGVLTLGIQKARQDRLVRQKISQVAR